MTKIQRFARNQSCTLRIPGVCCGDPEKVVLAHAHGAGMGIKTNDKLGCHACHPCHDWLDRVATAEEYERAFWPAHLETLKRVDREGLL